MQRAKGLARFYVTASSRALASPVPSFGARANPTFQLVEDYRSDSALPVFTVGRANGFLPRKDPIDVLPAQFDSLEHILQRMPVYLRNGGRGLLARGELGDEVLSRFPLLDVSEITDLELLAALYRDYTFLASAYLLEPCDLEIRRTGDSYGLGRPVLPKQIAVPLSILADRLFSKPFMEYAQSYALYNFRRIDPSRPHDYKNLDVIRSFAGSESEVGFILVHVAMVRHSGALVSATVDTIDAAARGDRDKFNAGLEELVEAARRINFVMDTMWGRSEPSGYKDFRTFIMGTKNQPMFPNGVLYEGVSDQPTFFRGESGANDSIVPTLDNLLQLTERMPQNPLTETLMDFRTYRPSHHSAWVTWVEARAREIGVRAFAEADPNSAVTYVEALDQIREFRDRHWRFTKAYILKYTNHPVATGGSPIIHWLPNQLSAVLTAIQDVSAKIGARETELTPDKKEVLGALRDRAATEARILAREVRKLEEMKKSTEDVTSA
ncbi:putative surface protein with EGF domain [Gonapodya prolifera JEL478]|uniref:Putative surface protein with EGF domain n=1 Tax=Gonapodya prolifera (strain JEL478) TaxID=1344416 RepID=A0A139AJ39_GONPJ|nr:putative surface protein with EGF domain [Gonapodya prolifera JEL478]|eukprot:KXS16821.1 putative surface protein with EGF domain [Gonapodya prolifera JEL478]